MVNPGNIFKFNLYCWIYSNDSEQIYIYATVKNQAKNKKNCYKVSHDYKNVTHSFLYLK